MKAIHYGIDKQDHQHGDHEREQSECKHGDWEGEYTQEKADGCICKCDQDCGDDGGTKAVNLYPWYEVSGDKHDDAHQQDV